MFEDLDICVDPINVYNILDDLDTFLFTGDWENEL